MPSQMFAVKHDDLVDFQPMYYIYTYTRVSPNISLVMQYHGTPRDAIFFFTASALCALAFSCTLYVQEHACINLIQRLILRSMYVLSICNVFFFFFSLIQVYLRIPIFVRVIANYASAFRFN